MERIKTIATRDLTKSVKTGYKEVNPMDNKKPSEPPEPERWAKLI